MTSSWPRSAKLANHLTPKLKSSHQHYSMGRLIPYSNMIRAFYLFLHKDTHATYFEEIWNGHHVTGRHPKAKCSLAISPTENWSGLPCHFAHCLVLLLWSPISLSLSIHCAPERFSPTQSKTDRSSLVPLFYIAYWGNYWGWNIFINLRCF